MSEEIQEKNEFLNYKGYPLVRCKDTIYYGNMYDEFVVVIQILQTKKTGDMEIASKVKMYKMLTDEKLPANKKILKQVEKDSLYDALDTASYWLTKTA